MMMDCRRNFLRISAYGNLDRNRLWPLNLLCLVETPITIFEQYFRFDADLRINFPFFSEREKGLVAFGHNSLKITLDLQKPISLAFGKN